jgi:hypothetical protein
VLQRLWALRAYLQYHAGIAGHRMHLLHFGKFPHAHEPLTFAPTGRIDMNKGKKRLAGRLAIKPCSDGPDHSGGTQALDPFEHRRRNARVAALQGNIVPTTAIVVQTLSANWLVELEIVAAA